MPYSTERIKMKRLLGRSSHSVILYTVGKAIEMVSPCFQERSICRGSPLSRFEAISNSSIMTQCGSSIINDGSKVQSFRLANLQVAARSAGHICRLAADLLHRKSLFFKLL